MKLKDIVKLLNAEIYTPDTFDGEVDLYFAFGSDLMSDALMLLRTASEEFFEHGILLTGLVTNQSIRTAEMLDFKLVIIVRGKRPSQSVFDSAIETGITVIGTPCSMFSASGKLYEHGVRGVTDL